MLCVFGRFLVSSSTEVCGFSMALLAVAYCCWEGYEYILDVSAALVVSSANVIVS